jgi:hypothetical protein
MRARGLEPPRSYEHTVLSRACLPIPARPLESISLEPSAYNHPFSSATLTASARFRASSFRITADR